MGGMFEFYLCFLILRVEFLLKTDSGYLRDTGVFFHSRWQPLRVPFALTPSGLKVEFLLKTDSGYPKETGVTLFTLATPGNPFHYNTHRFVFFLSFLGFEDPT